MTNAAIYVRVSSAKQAEEGLSLGEQEKRCRAYAESRGWRLDPAHIFIEQGISGTKARRPALGSLMAAVEHDEIDYVVTPKIDRLGRNARHNLDLFERFDSAGVILCSPDGREHTDRFVRTLESAIAEREHENISERVRAVTPAKRARGSYNGGPRPYGYDYAGNGDLVVNVDEAVIVRRLFTEYLAGTPLRTIARSLNEEGVRGPLGGVWSSGRVGDRLDLALYAGYVGGGERGRHEPLIDADTWQRVKDLRSASAEREGKRKSGRQSNSHLLGNGLLVCSCGASMYPRKDSRSRRDTYRCRGRDERSTDCDMPAVPRRELDAAVRGYIAGQVLSPGLAEGELQSEAKKAEQEAAAEAAAAAARVSKLEARLRRARDLMLDGKLEPDEYAAMKEEMSVEMASARTRATEASRLAAQLRAPSNEIMAAVEAIRRMAADEARDATSVASQRTAISRLFSRFEIVSSATDDEPPEALPDNVRALVEQQNAAVEEATEGTPEFSYKPYGQPVRRVILVPIPRQEVAERFGWDPIDGLPELQNVRKGLP